MTPPTINRHPRDFYTNNVIEYTNWKEGSPNGNFVDKDSYWMYWVYNGGESRLVHDSVTKPICFACLGRSPILTTLTLRGLCLDSQFDRNYILATEGADLLFFQGDRHTNITYSNGTWTMTATRTTMGASRIEPAVSATSSSPKNSLLLGRHQFRFESDVQCTSEKNFDQWVVLTSCAEDEFTCKDGACIKMERRWDIFLSLFCHLHQ